jgi:transcriptional regulator with XRE-family HTH domain
MSVTGDDIRRIRAAFGWSIERFSRVLGVHPVTLNRWELSGTRPALIEGMPRAILLGLQERLFRAQEGRRAAAEQARQVASDVDRLLIVGGVLLALGALLAFVNAKK